MINTHTQKARPSGPQRFLEAAEGHLLKCDPVQLSVHARSAALAAEALGCGVAEIANSLVFKGERSGLPILVLASGGHRVDLTRAAEALGEPLAKANAAFVREHSGYAIGGVAPIGHATPMRILIDASLLQFEQVWAAAGAPEWVVAIDPRQLQQLTGGQLLELAEPS